MFFQNLSKEKKNLIIFIILAVSCLLFVVLSTPNSNQITCSFCKETISEDDVTYCPYCGESMSASQNFEEDSSKTLISDSKKIIGTWQYTHSSWGLFEYVFYSDGFCKGTYIGKPNERFTGDYIRVGYVYAALYPFADSVRYSLSGDGHWYFVDNKLKIEYTDGEGIYSGRGTIYYTYSFDEDGTELTIYGEELSSEPVVWTKVN